MHNKTIIDKDRICLTGKIYFDPDDKTTKHKSQASWKKMAMVVIKGDVTEYYAWFIKKRFGLDLTKPLRGAHISFINDHVKDMNGNWEKVKKKYHRKEIKIVLDVRPDIQTPHWWLIVPHDERGELQGIRSELGLKKPYFGMHMTIGSAVDKKSDVKNDTNSKTAKKMNLAHCEYIKGLIDKGQIKF